MKTLLACRGAVVLSGYDHPVYGRLTEAGWERLAFNTACHAAVKTRNSGLQGNRSCLRKVPRTETVWRNPRAVQTAAAANAA
ncbi:MAG: hypothetical protein GYA33_07790 [Thermogutta sp.]|nr:hypothetical protein [Thermogutta sp.]